MRKLLPKNKGRGCRPGLQFSPQNPLEGCGGGINAATIDAIVVASSVYPTREGAKIADLGIGADDLSQRARDICPTPWPLHGQRDCPVRGCTRCRRKAIVQQSVERLGQDLRAALAPNSTEGRSDRA